MKEKTRNQINHDKHQNNLLDFFDINDKLLISDLQKINVLGVFTKKRLNLNPEILAGDLEIFNAFEKISEELSPLVAFFIQGFCAGLFRYVGDPC